MNTNARSKDGVEAAIENYNSHPSVKIINENVSFESCFSFKEILESGTKKEVSNLNSKKAGTFGNIPTKVLKDSSDISNSILQNIWNYEILGKRYFSKNLKLADATTLYKKKDPTVVEHYRPFSVLPCVSKAFERRIQKHFSSFIDEFLSPYLRDYRKSFNTKYALFLLIEK